MKLLAPVVLLATTASAIQLPFAIPSGVKSALSSATEHIRVPQFLKNLADPIAASPVLSLHRSLVEIPSVTGNERAVAEWLADWLTANNFTVETQAVGGFGGDRMNVFAYVGKNRTTHTLVTSHIDTVPPFIPYKAAVSTIYGRGSNDAKGSVAAQITAVQELVKEGVLGEGDVSLLYVVGEELSGDGMKAANHLGTTWKTVIFGEPTELKLAKGHKGILLFHVVSQGKASHSGYPHLGINANSNLIRALARLDDLHLPASDLLGESTLNIGRIDGGVAPNVIPAFAKADVAVRVAGDLDETIAMIKDAVKGIEGVRLEFMDVGYGPVELDYDVEGFELTVCSYGTDVPNLKGDHKKYLYGPGS
jgi:acetylornithine deacetylase